MGMIQKAIPFRRFDHSKRKREGRKKIRNGDRESHFPSQIVSSSRSTSRDSEKQEGRGKEENKVKYPIKFSRLHNGVNNRL